MLHGRSVTLRAREDGDVPVLHAELHEDVESRSRASGAAWRPVPLQHSPYRPAEARAEVAEFTVVDRDRGELLGIALLWGIDSHNRHAHVGISLRRSFHSMGYGTDALETLCAYAFRTLGLHRLQLETLADNQPMLAAASHVGFRVEGTAREHSWVAGHFADEVTLGILADEWLARGSGEGS